MALLLPDGHPYVKRSTSARREGALRIGIVNVMPRVEKYEPLLLGPLERAGRDVEPVFLRLASHGYASSEPNHLGRFYRPVADAWTDRPLDGLILTGAPVEQLPFAEVRYMHELVDFLGEARARAVCTLGLCWGGLALAHVEGIGKVVRSRKLFGVFEATATAPHALLGRETSFVCAQSRHSDVDEDSLTEAERAGKARRIAGSEGTGTTLFESADGRFVMHLGHPEYVAQRIAFEWERDRELGRPDVAPPVGFDPTRSVEAWAGHRESFFRAWVARLVDR